MDANRNIGNKDIPKVSIGMPVYNGERFIRKALDSLLAQTFTDFELIISDNASTDGTFEICKEYVAKDKRIKYIRQIENKGMNFNFIFLCRIARGDYFMWAASDDLWDREFIQILYAAISTDKNYSSSFCSYVYINDSGDWISKPLSSDFSGNIITRIYKYCFYYDDTMMYSLFKTSTIRQLKIRAWWGINAKILADVGYPPPFFILSSGKFAFISGRPLWFQRLHNSHQYLANYNFDNIILKYLMLVPRKVNILFYSIKNIYAGSQSIWIVLLTMPALIGRFLYDCINPIGKKLRRTFLRQ
jgi:glycosyltransferase involved in cell wall biosynthesis